MMKLSSYWLPTLTLVCALAFGPALAGSAVQHAPADRYLTLCEEPVESASQGQIAGSDGFVLAQVRADREPRSQTVAPRPAQPPQPPQATNQMKAPRQSVAKIGQGDCCGPVLGGCVSWCNKPGGCTGEGDCDTFKAN